MSRRVGCGSAVAGVPGPKLARIAPSARAALPAGATVMPRGQAGRELFVILDGTAIVPAPDGGQRQLGPECPSAMAALDGHQRSGAVQTKRAFGLLAPLRQHVFLTLLGDEPCIASLIHGFARRARRLEQP